jgi:hypothetical protein
VIESGRLSRRSLMLCAGAFALAPSAVVAGAQKYEPLADAVRWHWQRQIADTARPNALHDDR